MAVSTFSGNWLFTSRCGEGGQQPSVVGVTRWAVTTFKSIARGLLRDVFPLSSLVSHLTGSDFVASERFCIVKFCILCFSLFISSLTDFYLIRKLSNHVRSRGRWPACTTWTVVLLLNRGCGMKRAWGGGESVRWCRATVGECYPSTLGKASRLGLVIHTD